MPEIGRAGQERLLASRVRAGGQGLAVETACELLAAAGVAVERAPLGPPEVAGRHLAAAGFVDGRLLCAACAAALLETGPAADPIAAFQAGAACAAEILLALVDPQRAPAALSVFPSPGRLAPVARAGCACPP